jgi:hypothetical protein
VRDVKHPRADDGPHVELAARVQRHVGARLAHVAAHLAARVGLGRDAADGAVANDLHGQSIQLL